MKVQRRAGQPGTRGALTTQAPWQRRLLMPEKNQPGRECIARGELVSILYAQ